jgi:hypothetical protein
MTNDGGRTTDEHAGVATLPLNRIGDIVRPWWRLGLLGALANLVLLAPGMGIAGGALPVGLGLGLLVGQRARRLAAGDRRMARRLALWGGVVAGGLAMHAEMLYDLVIMMLFGPKEMGRSFTPELYGAMPWLRGWWPQRLDSIGAFWVLQALGFATIGYGLVVLTAWLWARRHMTTKDERRQAKDGR